MQSRVFTAPNEKYGKEPNEKRIISFPLQCVFGPEGVKYGPITAVTKVSGLPQTSAASLKVLCGKKGAAKEALASLKEKEKEKADCERAAGHAGGGEKLKHFKPNENNRPLHPGLPMSVCQSRCVSEPLDHKLSSLQARGRSVVHLIPLVLHPCLSPGQLTAAVHCVVH